MNTLTKYLVIQVIYIYVYAVQQDTQSVSMSDFYSALMLAGHISELIGPSSGAFFLQVCMSDWSSL